MSLFKRSLIVVIALFSIAFSGQLRAQSTLSLTLKEAIQLATDSSLASFKAKNMYLAGYWDYRSYKASKLPQMVLNTTPIDYNRAFIKRYNSGLDIDEYKEQQNIYSYANTSITQNLPFSGGTVYVDSELGYLKNFGDGAYTQYNSVPVRIGVTQRLFGFNNFKWQKKIEPLKYEKIKKELVKSNETISKQLIDYYFSLIIAQNQVAIAQTNRANADTLYTIGRNRLAIASLSQADVLSLKVDVLNAENALAEAKKGLKKSQLGFNSFLRLPEEQAIELSTPEQLADIQIDPKIALEYAEANDPDLLSFRQQQLEAGMNLEKTRRDNRFNATFNASYGYNQKAASFARSYQNPLDQQRVMVSFSIPLVDWGQKRGKYLMAKRNMDVVNASCEQLAVDFRQNVLMAITDFNLQFQFVKSALETRDVAKLAYETTKQRFLLGKVDVTTLSLILKRQDDANLNYLNALYLYWRYYYTVRELTMFDFMDNQELSVKFDDLFKIKQ